MPYSLVFILLLSVYTPLRKNYGKVKHMYKLECVAEPSERPPGACHCRLSHSQWRVLEGLCSQGAGNTDILAKFDRTIARGAIWCEDY